MNTVLILFLPILFSSFLLKLVDSKRPCQMCRSKFVTCRHIYPHCDKKRLISYCKRRGIYHCVEKKERLCPMCSKKGYTCTNIYPNCDFDAFITKCSNFGRIYCVEKDLSVNDCENCLKPDNICQRMTSNCKIIQANHTNVCSMYGQLYCILKRKKSTTMTPTEWMTSPETTTLTIATTTMTVPRTTVETQTKLQTKPTINNCTLCEVTGFRCVLKPSKCNNDNVIEYCFRNGELFCVEKVILSTSTKISISPTLMLNNLCQFSKVAFWPVNAVLECRENCLPATNYTDLSKIGICYKGKCCLNKQLSKSTCS